MDAGVDNLWTHYCLGHHLARPSDPGTRGLTALGSRIDDYHDRSAQLDWLLTPKRQAVEMWPASGVGDLQRIGYSRQPRCRPPLSRSADRSAGDLAGMSGTNLNRPTQ